MQHVVVRVTVTFDIAPRRGPKGMRTRNAEVRQLFYGGSKIAELARRFNLTHQRVRQIVGCYRRTLDMRGMLGTAKNLQMKPRSSAGFPRNPCLSP